MTAGDRPENPSGDHTIAPFPFHRGFQCQEVPTVIRRIRGPTVAFEPKLSLGQRISKHEVDTPEEDRMVDLVDPGCTRTRGVLRHIVGIPGLCYMARLGERGSDAACHGDEGSLEPETFASPGQSRGPALPPP